MVALSPALTRAGSFTVKTTLLVVNKHGPLGSSVVKVSVTVPILEANGVKVTDAGVRVGKVLLS